MLRVTRQNIEALISGDTPYARIARVHLQVLCSPAPASLEASASNAISISGVATYTKAHNPSAANAILVSQSLDYIGPRDVSASSTLVMTSSCRVPQVFEESVSSVLTITSTTDPGHRKLTQEASSTLTIYSYADHVIAWRDAMSVISISDSAVAEVTSKSGIAASVILISQSAVSHLHTPSASNTISVSQTAVGKNTAVHVEASNSITVTDSVTHIAPKRLEASSNLTTYTYDVDPETGQPIVITSGITSTAVAEVVSVNKQASSVIDIQQAVVYELDRVGYYERHAESVITVTSSVDRDFTVESIIEVTQSAVVEVTYQPRSILEITQTAVPQLMLNREASSVISVAQTVAYEVVDRFNRCTYSPFIGSSTDPDAPTPPAITPPMTSLADAFIMERGADVLTLRLPQLGNHDRLDFTRVHRESRGGRLEVFADPIWPKTENMQLTFIGMCSTEISDVLTFISNTLGQEIIIHDWENRSWYGYITNPTAAAVRDTRDTFTIALELDVIEDDAELVGGASVIAITQTAVAEVV